MLNPDLSPQQRELLDVLWDTTVEIPITRREEIAGTYRFYSVTRATRPIDFRVHQGEFVFKLHESRPDALLSPVKVNFRNLPDILVNHIAQVLAAVSLDKKPDFCAGIPNAGTALAKEYAKLTGIPWLDLFRKKETENSRSVEPYPLAPIGNSSKHVLIIDDVVTEAGSKLEGAQVTKELGYQIAGVLVLIDREEAGRQILAEHGYLLDSAFSLRAALQYYWESGRITTDQYQEYLTYQRLVTTS